jgi:hypothetical protein
MVFEETGRRLNNKLVMLSIAKHLYFMHGELCMTDKQSLKVLRDAQHDSTYFCVRDGSGYRPVANARAV